jgi:hypothetical protein
MTACRQPTVGLGSKPADLSGAGTPSPVVVMRIACSVSHPGVGVVRSTAIDLNIDHLEALRYRKISGAENSARARACTSAARLILMGDWRDSFSADRRNSGRD